jgi:hypothetical protein
MFTDLATAELMYNQLHSNVVQLTRQVLLLQQENNQLKELHQTVAEQQCEIAMLNEQIMSWQHRWAAVRSVTEGSGIELPGVSHLASTQPSSPHDYAHRVRRGYGVSDSIMSRVSFFETVRPPKKL